ncbi:MAG: 4-hydroxythreonine-4-phosphate dehydrogenase PdxA [Bacteroidota bacterium]
MQNTRRVLRIGISIGDVNGIGPELIIRGLRESSIRERCTPIIYGSPRALNIYRKILSIDKFSYNVIQEPSQAHPRKVYVIDCIRSLDRVDPGKPSMQTGQAAFEALAAAVADLKAGEIDALVTLPIDKATIQNRDFQFPGHTEYLTEKLEGTDSLMFMVHESLKVGVVTGHIPLKDVSAALTVDKIVRKIELMSTSLRQDFNLEKPRIAVLGVNPHAGDNGLLGKEDREKIQRAVQSVEKGKHFVFGPYPADGFFGSGTWRRFDGVLAMYHDQGLIPFKLLVGFEGVNYTAGLPAIRTSPDHGLAYDLAGAGRADITSFINAIYSALEITRNRRESVAIEENSLWQSPPDMSWKKDRRPRDRQGPPGPRGKTPPPTVPAPVPQVAVPVNKSEESKEEE